MKLRDFLIEKATIPDWREGTNPDRHYGKRGSSVWIYKPPILYWYNPKTGGVFQNNKEIMDKETTEDSLFAGEKDFPSGKATHMGLETSLKNGANISFGGRNDPSIIRGRSYKGDHQYWDYSWTTPSEERMKDKSVNSAIALAEKYIK